MTSNKFTKKVTNFWTKLDQKLDILVPNETIFRLLNHSKINLKNKKVFDIGMSDGSNLLECKKRGAEIFGTDIRKKAVTNFYKKYKFKKENFFVNDLNYSFPRIKKKMDLIICKDTICYIDKPKQILFLKNCSSLLKKNGYILIQYIQAQVKQHKRKSFNYRKSLSGSHLKDYHHKENPINYLSNSHIKNIVKQSKLRIEESIFDVATHTKKNEFKYHIIDVNRFLLLKKI
jgi:2-polyprenyl-3-methyl-5-hydroxy-6-metoxy-1,4-benzoquinol methylase